MKYRVLVAAPTGPGIGDILEEYRGPDYGLVRYDSMCYGERCIALSSGKDSPLFYVLPISHVEPL